MVSYTIHVVYFAAKISVRKMTLLVQTTPWVKTWQNLSQPI